jgi:hypothetical protein
MDWNTHPRFPGLAGDGRGAFSIVLVENQIDYVLLVGRRLVAAE